jgi:hypothetical protein
MKIENWLDVEMEEWNDGKMEKWVLWKWGNA